MDTTLHLQPDTHEKQEKFDLAIEGLRGTIKELQKTIHPQNQFYIIAFILDDIESIFNNLMDQNERLDSDLQMLNFQNERYALWKQSLADAILFILTHLNDKSLREALERLHERVNQWSIEDSLLESHHITIGL